MNISEKIIATCEARRISQAELGRMADVSSGKISEMFKQRYEFSQFHIKCAKALGLDLNWAYDDTQGLPIRTVEERGAHMTAAQRKVLDLAEEVSQGDPEMMPARRRLVALEPQAAAPPQQHGPVQVEGRDRPGPPPANGARRPNSDHA